jgi:hypothetical protein
MQDLLDFSLEGESLLVHVGIFCDAENRSILNGEHFGQACRVFKTPRAMR